METERLPEECSGRVPLSENHSGMETRYRTKNQHQPAQLSENHSGMETIPNADNCRADNFVEREP